MYVGFTGVLEIVLLIVQTLRSESITAPMPATATRVFLRERVSMESNSVLAQKIRQRTPSRRIARPFTVISF